jgi:hypothetical protein
VLAIVADHEVHCTLQGASQHVVFIGSLDAP